MPPASPLSDSLISAQLALSLANFENLCLDSFDLDLDHLVDGHSWIVKSASGWGWGSPDSVGGKVGVKCGLVIPSCSAMVIPHPLFSLESNGWKEARCPDIVEQYGYP
jgi:hypothetical protein